jgi:transcriptional regulator with XRE-family HTH domain
MLMKMVSRRGLDPADFVDEAEGPHPVDRHVGLCIRMRRKELGVSQERLAEALGLTFQQIQKYERAANRVSASKLFEIARALSTNVSYFYDGLDGADELELAPSSSMDAQVFLITPEGAELATLFPKLKRSRVRRKIVELVRALVDMDEEAEAAVAAAPTLVTEQA